MRWSARLTVLFVIVGTLAQAQTGTGELRGVLSTARGPFAGLEVRVKNVGTGEVQTTTTSSSGAYSIKLPPGRYELFASRVGYGTLALRDLEVRAGATV